jgi:iron complex outermembrane receptor protein
MPLADGIRDNRDQSLGNWAGTQLTYRFDLPRRFGSLTLGSELNADIRTLQRNFDVQPAYSRFLNVNDRDLNFAVFLQHEWRFHRDWTANLGLRGDESRNHGHFLSPRAALIYQQSPQTVFKIMSGIAFRNPNAYEQFYDDQGTSQIPNPWLRPEQIQSSEAAIERKLSKELSAVAAAYHYRLRELIEAVPVADGIVQYQNVSRYRATGGEFELNAHLSRSLEMAGSAAVENLAKLRAHEPQAPNSPRVLLKFRGGVPLNRGRFCVGAAFQYISTRRTFADADSPPVYLTDLTVTSNRLHPAFDLQLGVRNLFDRRDWDPASPDQGLDRLARDGRSVFVKLIWHTLR